ncbi:hypothetical protein UPYG_G00165200 [Umbra pygmaea]|uniref:Uncharacterized protein n=1 Tax=Umbra pygmaea TaxID=75934 RepID=A0ABD0WME5_UMBPY
MAAGLLYVVLLLYTFHFIKAQVQKPRISFQRDEENVYITCEIPGHAGNDTSCILYVGEQSERHMPKVFSSKGSRKKQWFCQVVMAKDNLIRRLESVRSKEVSCEYTLSSGPNYFSPRSDGYTFTGHSISNAGEDGTALNKFPVSVGTSPSPTAASSDDIAGGQSSTKSLMKINSQYKNIVELLWPAGVGVASGVGVFLVGLTAFCLCKKTKKNNSQRAQAQNDDHRKYLVMGAMNTGGLVDSGDNSIGFYSVNPSVPSTLIPSGPVGESGSENHNSATYHIYCSIPDRPAALAQPNGRYSFLQEH